MKYAGFQRKFGQYMFFALLRWQSRRFLLVCHCVCVCVCVYVCPNSCRINRLIFMQFGTKIIPLLITPVLCTVINIKTAVL